MLFEEKYHPDLSAMLFIVSEMNPLSERCGIQAFDHRGVVGAAESPRRLRNPFEQG